MALSGAFAEFAGKSLPTIFHWWAAAGRPSGSADLITLSNFRGQGPVAAGSTDASRWREMRLAGGEAATTADCLVRHLADLAPVPSLWWSKGSQQVPPSVLISAALPRPEGFAALLDGQWSTWGWGQAA